MNFGSRPRLCENASLDYTYLIALLGGAMKRFIQGEDRNQSTLLPELLDDYIAEENPVRVIDVFAR